MSVSAIAAAIQADATIAGIVGTRVTDRDIRRVGWESSPTYFDTDGVIRPTVMVDDAGSTRPAFGHTAERMGSVYVWVFGPRTAQGRAAIKTITDRIENEVMPQWHVPGTGAMVLPVFRLGQQSDEDVTFDRVTLQLGGVLATSRF
jgi:hypothetical protein